MQVVAGVDLGGTAINYTLVNRQGQFLIAGLCEHPALSKQGPEVCLQQIADGLKIASDKAGVQLSDVVAVGLDTPGPASAGGQFSAREIQVLELIVRGLANKQIAYTLNIAEHTVKNHVKNILSKLGVQDRTQAATAAIQRGIIHL